MSSDKVLGIVVVARHGDRQGFYQDPDSYTASATAITPLGEVIYRFHPSPQLGKLTNGFNILQRQEFELGSLLRSLYLNPSSSSYIQGISNSSSLFQQNQVAVRADAGGEGGVIFDSAVALLQGLWPATTLSSTTLANGTTVTSPLGGYQYVPSTPFLHSIRINERTNRNPQSSPWNQTRTFRSKDSPPATYVPMYFVHSNLVC